MLPVRERVPGSFAGDPAQQNIQTSGKSLLLSKGYVSTAPATRVPGVGVPLIRGGGTDSGTAQTEPGGPWVAPAVWTDDSSSFSCSSALPTCLLAGAASVLLVSTTAVPAKLVSSVVQIWRSPSCPNSSPAQLVFLDPLHACGSPPPCSELFLPASSHHFPWRACWTLSGSSSQVGNRGSCWAMQSVKWVCVKVCGRQAGPRASSCPTPLAWPGCHLSQAQLSSCCVGLLGVAWRLCVPPTMVCGPSITGD